MEHLVVHDPGMSHAARTRSIAPAAAAWGAAVAAVALLGGLATDTSSDWYLRLDRPSWQPPGSVFGPVWTVLYLLLAASAALAWRDVRGPQRRLVIGLYAANLAMNLGWTILFFRLHAPWGAALDIAGLLASIVVLCVLVRRHNALAAAALAPYAVWVAFAAALTVTIAVDN
jgi:tryptophan-rich sensory protein